MVQELLACPSCQESVPPGRLSCPHCGAVLTAVAGPAHAAISTPAWPGPAATRWPPASLDDGDRAADPGVVPHTALDGTAVADPHVAVPVAPEPTEPRLPAPAPGAWLPPAIEEPPPVDHGSPPPWSRSRTLAAATGSAAGPVAAPTGPSSSAAIEGRSLPSIDRARVDEAAGGLVLAGSMATAIGFLVPWSRVVIGAGHSGDYTDTWGLAGPGHVVVFLLAAAVLALAAVPNPIGPWLRTGVLGIALGSLVIGLVWPYAVGPLGAGPGIVLLVVAAVLLVVGGVTSLAVNRHEPGPPPV